MPLGITFFLPALAAMVGLQPSDDMLVHVWPPRAPPAEPRAPADAWPLSAPTASGGDVATQSSVLVPGGRVGTEQSLNSVWTRQHSPVFPPMIGSKRPLYIDQRPL